MTTYDRAAAGVYTPDPDYDLPAERDKLMTKLRRDLMIEHGVTDLIEEAARWTVAKEFSDPSQMALNYAGKAPISLRIGQDIALAATVRDTEPRSNGHLVHTTGGVVGTVRDVFPAFGRTLEPPVHLNERPPCFPQAGCQHAHSPTMRTLTIKNGTYWNCAEIPIVLSGNAIIRDFSPARARLVQAYDTDAVWVMGKARVIEGQAIVLPDYGPAFNICHWTADWLIRSATVRAEECTALVPTLTQQWQRDTLALIGFKRVVEVPRFTAVIADELIATSDQAEVAHPASKAAPWAIQYLRQELSAKPPWDWPTKIYISREDALGRKMLNEDALLSGWLTALGYTKVVLSRMSFVQQAMLFTGATHVVSMHGAGLTHILFAEHLKSVVEIFAGDYGTPAFYVLAAAGGARYATYREPAVIHGERPQLDSIMLDVDDFMVRARDYL